MDEAHLISQWGHDFRPDYMRLGAQAEAVGAPVRLALTATAAPPVRRKSSGGSACAIPEVVLGDFDRPRIHLSAQHARTVADKERELVRAAREFSGPGIVYAATHADAQAAQDCARAAGERVTLYHAGLSGRDRHEAMTAFLDGSARIIAATVAFGMGIDKPDVRWVLHVRPAAVAGRVLPGDRPGRAGQPAVAGTAALPVRGLRAGAAPARAGRGRRGRRAGRGRARGGPAGRARATGSRRPR